MGHEVTRTQFKPPAGQPCGAKHRLHDNEGYDEVECEESSDPAKHPRTKSGAWLHRASASQIIPAFQWNDPLPECGYTIRKPPLSHCLVFRRESDGAEIRFNPEWVDEVFDLTVGDDSRLKGAQVAVIGGDKDGSILFWTLKHIVAAARALAASEDVGQSARCWDAPDARALEEIREEIGRFDAEVRRRDCKHERVAMLNIDPPRTQCKDCGDDRTHEYNAALSRVDAIQRRIEEEGSRPCGSPAEDPCDD